MFFLCLDVVECCAYGIQEIQTKSTGICSEENDGQKGSTSIPKGYDSWDDGEEP